MESDYDAAKRQGTPDRRGRHLQLSGGSFNAQLLEQTIYHARMHACTLG